jgi:glycosyltransferase involved in cell wall biosynthesis
VRVAVNAQLLSYRRSYRSAGISRYLDRTLAHLPDALDPGDRARAFVGPEVPPNAPAMARLEVERARLPTERPLARILWEQLVLPIAARRWRADLLHAGAHVAPLLGACPTVVTFHDLSFYLYPAAFNRPNRLYLQTFARRSARLARRIIAVSESTRRDVVRLLGVAPEKVDVAWNGVDSWFRPEADPERLRAFRSEQHLSERFILFLGTLEPRKNLPTLLRAYALARRQGVEEPLILAGGMGWGDLELARLVDELDLRAAVRTVGYVSPGEQASWYNAATLLAYPSLYEGFGLPALEAMACGTPVVASDRSSLPEVVGDAGLLVDPVDPAALADALARVLRDEALRGELGARGIERARRFTWEAAARATVQTYRRALASEPAHSETTSRTLGPSGKLG